MFLFITEYLKVRSHDPEEAIRHDVIVTIITAGKRDLSLVNDQLLGFVRERTLDKRVSVNILFSGMSAFNIIFFCFYFYQSSRNRKSWSYLLTRMLWGKFSYQSILMKRANCGDTNQV